MKISKFVVSAIDTGDSCDGKARVLLITDKLEEAQAYVRNDMEEYVDEATTDDGDCAYSDIDFDRMYVRDKSYNGCEWNIETIEHEIPDEFKEYLTDYLKLLNCDYNDVLELSDSDPAKIKILELIKRIKELLDLS